MVDYRPFPDDRGEEFMRLLSYAFSPEDGPVDPEETEETRPQARVGENRGLFDGDEPVSVCRHHYFDTRVRDAPVRMAGLSAVATPPEHRRQGMIRRLLGESLREYRDRGAAIASLWPFETPFYAQFGWATAFHAVVQTGDPSVFRVGNPPEGEYYRAEKDDWEALDAVLDAHAVDYALAVDRTEAWWRNRAFHGWQTDPYVYVWERDGEPSGYVVYSIAEEDGDKTLGVWDMAFVDAAAHRALLRFLADHDSQVDRVRLTAPRAESILDHVSNPADLEVTLEAGAMVRIVDVARALSAISYPASLDGHVTISVSDPLVDWNDGTFEVSVADGSATIERTTGPADVEIDIGPLSQLFVGHRTLSALEDARDATVHDHDAAALLASAFPASDVYLREGF